MEVREAPPPRTEGCFLHTEDSRGLHSGSWVLRHPPTQGSEGPAVTITWSFWSFTGQVPTETICLQL